MTPAPVFGQPIGQEDLEVGLFVTVYKWDDPPLPVPEPQEEGLVFMARVQSHPDPRSYLQGLPMKIHRIELPYILALGPDDHLRVIDFREVELMKLTEEYYIDICQTFERGHELRS